MTKNTQKNFYFQTEKGVILKKILYIILIFIGSCSFFTKDYYYDVKKETKNSTSIKTENDTIAVLCDSLKIQAELYENRIDSLYSIIDNQNYTIDSLYQELEIANSRIAVNPNFVIPDSFEFAGKTFNLKNERVYDKFEKIFKLELKGAFKYIPRTGKYFPIIDSILAKYHIPEDAKYIAVAESRLNPMATSRVGAAGIWQFMKRTAQGYGMKINSFVDERRDVFKSTEAAAKFLKNSHQYLLKLNSDDWLLSFCAFNAGLGSISRLIKSQKQNNFFDLVFKTEETHKYLWRAIAIKMILENEEKIFGKKFERQKNLLSQVRIEKVKLKGYYKIDNWVKAQGTSLPKVLELNPWIKIYKRRRKRYSSINDVVLPPGNYNILIPKNSAKNLAEIKRIEKIFLKKNSGYFTYHIVKKGDNLWKIARKYHMSVAKIKALNNLRSNTIRPGQKLRLYGRSGSSTSSKRVYTVKKGDSIYKIAAKLKISAKRLISKNHLKKNKNGNIIIHPGQKLYY